MKKSYALIYLIFFLFCGSLFLIRFYLVYSKLPKSKAMDVAIEYLKSNSKVREKAGNFRSYTFKKSQLPLDSDSLAAFSIDYEGQKSSIQLLVKLKRHNLDEWRVETIEF